MKRSYTCWICTDCACGAPGPAPACNRLDGSPSLALPFSFDRQSRESCSPGSHPKPPVSRKLLGTTSTAEAGLRTPAPLPGQGHTGRSPVTAGRCRRPGWPCREGTAAGTALLRASPPARRARTARLGCAAVPGPARPLSPSSRAAASWC